MDYRKSAQEVLDLVGGAGNIVSAAHCATRLRLVIADNARVDKQAIEGVDGVKGVFEAQGQLQIIFGTGTVNKVYDEFIALGGISAASKAEAKEAAAQQQNVFMRAIKLLGDIFVPIIPAIVASGLLLGIMSALNFMNANGFIAIDTDNFVYKIADLVSGTSFTFLQILIGYSAASAFGANPYLGAVVGMALINPSLQSAYTVAADGVSTVVPVIPGLYGFDWVGYQGHVIPIVISVWILSVLEKRLHKVVPEMLDLFVTPLVSVFVTVLVTLVAVGPVFVWAENAILGVIQALLTLPFGIGAFIIGGFYAPTVVTGIHQMYTAIDLGQLAQYGVTYWLPIASAANIAQGGAALAVALKTRDAKIKGLALPSALSAFMGITEPAIFGVNLRFFKPFVAGCIGGACGALVCAITGLSASGTGVTGIFGILLCLAQPVQYAVMFAVAAVVSFAVSFALYRDERPVAAAAPGVAAASAAASEVPAAASAANEEPAAPAAPLEVAVPCAGSVVACADIPDPTFSAEILGPTVAVDPTGPACTITAPCDAEVSLVFETGHAVGLTASNGAELLIHAGIDTVKMEGAGFRKLVAQGDRVTAGQPLIEMDVEAVRAAGYSPVTMLIASNALDGFKVSKRAEPGPCAAGAPAMEIARA